MYAALAADGTTREATTLVRVPCGPQQPDRASLVTARRRRAVVLASESGRGSSRGLSGTDTPQGWICAARSSPTCHTHSTGRLTYRHPHTTAGDRHRGQRHRRHGDALLRRRSCGRIRGASGVLRGGPHVQGRGVHGAGHHPAASRLRAAAAGEPAALRRAAAQPVKGGAAAGASNTLTLGWVASTPCRPYSDMFGANTNE